MEDVFTFFMHLFLLSLFSFWVMRDINYSRNEQHSRHCLRELCSQGASSGYIDTVLGITLKGQSLH